MTFPHLRPRADLRPSSFLVVSNIIDVAELSFSSGQVTNVTNNGFTVALTGSLLNAWVHPHSPLPNVADFCCWRRGPFDALIEFPEGVDVIWQGNKIATISLPPICSAGGSGVPTLQTTGILTIANKGRFTDFATYILLNPGFTWTSEFLRPPLPQAVQQLTRRSCSHDRQASSSRSRHHLRQRRSHQGCILLRVQRLAWRHHRQSRLPRRFPVAEGHPARHRHLDTFAE